MQRFGWRRGFAFAALKGAARILRASPAARGNANGNIAAVSFHQRRNPRREHRYQPAFPLRKPAVGAEQRDQQERRAHRDPERPLT